MILKLAVSVNSAHHSSTSSSSSSSSKTKFDEFYRYLVNKLPSTIRPECTCYDVKQFEDSGYLMIKMTKTDRFNSWMDFFRTNNCSLESGPLPAQLVSEISE